MVKDVSPMALQPLPIIDGPKKETGAVWISGVSNAKVDWAVQVAKALQPAMG